jgi:molybdate transport system regulatory protein
MTKQDHSVELHGSVWITVGGENFGGRGRIGLLALVAETGSITRAAKAMKMSYKAAWDAIDAMNSLAGEALVERVTGGKGGGGTVLTARGQQLVQNFRLIEQEHRRFVSHLSGQAAGMTDDYLLIKRMSMKTSARNQFFGTVVSLKVGAVNDEVELEVLGGHSIVAIVTRDSTESLGLKVGAEAFALIKSSSIIVMTAGQGARLSARNQLTGQVTRVQPGAVNSEVVIELPGGGSVAAIITNESCTALNLTQGQQATAIFKASSVILGIPA